MNMSSPSPLIRILPPQLANQIAAGEVVERPASVVKELIENSLDAGANVIQLDIEKGGSQLIRLRDNGCGIGRQDLELALARHATSKIATLEDLENILSLGFRGEALASISSVSRLTLTSRPAYQQEAWQAYAQGRDMQVEIQPASHPVGTTIEVANLFFNTPARRKFLRTDKTEFSHIDEVVRRIALAKPTVTFILNHNDKKVRHYKAVENQNVAQQQKRVAAICGEEFIQNATHIDWQHGDLHLYGWVGSPKLARLQNDLCYSYVNGRMMRDKTINHAIRQAYGDYLPKESYPAFVLFLDLDPSYVDVNVHPAKHEVRFHQGRLVHDFIYQGVLNALQSTQGLPLVNEMGESLPTYLADTNTGASGKNIFAHSASSFRPASSTPLHNPSKTWQTKQTANHQHQQKWYAELLRSESGKQPAPDDLPPPVQEAVVLQKSAKISPLVHSEICEPSYHQALALVQNQALLFKQGETFYLIGLHSLARLRLRVQLNNVQRQSLLIPLSLTLDQSQQQRWQIYESELAALGFIAQSKVWQGQTRLTLLQVPTCLREQNLQQLLLGVLSQQAVSCCDFFATEAKLPTADSLSEVVGWLSEIEQDSAAQAQFDKLKIAVDFTDTLNQLAEMAGM